MLHGFKANDGEEVLAYIPRTVFSKLNKLTASGYGTSVPHEYYVDGSPIIAELKEIRLLVACLCHYDESSHLIITPERKTIGHFYASDGE